MSIEDRLRTDLHMAAEQGVEDGLRPPPYDAPSPLRRRHVWAGVAVAVAAATATAVVVAAVTAGSSDNGSPGTAQCVDTVTYRGHAYIGRGDGARVPEAGPPLGSGVRPPCNDGGPVDDGPGEQIDLYTLRDLNPNIAVISDTGQVYLRSDLDVLPAVLRDLDEPVRCTPSDTSVVGHLVGFTAATMGDTFTKPFALKLESTSLVAGYARVTVAVRFPNVAANNADHDLISQAVTEGREVRVQVHCTGESFVSDSLALE